MARLFDNRNHNKRKPTYVDVGGNGDCGFRAVAAGILNNFLLSHPPIDASLLDQLLKQHFYYFPQHRNVELMNANPAEQMHHLVWQFQCRMGELLQSLAYTLRQIAVDEMCKHPARYRGAFIDNHEQTSPGSMRKPTVWIDESAMAALSYALKMPIEVNVVDHGKGVPMRLCYGVNYEQSTVSTPKVVVRLQDGHYVPRVTLVDRFKAIQSSSQRALDVTVMTPRQNDPAMADILAAIANEDQKIVKTFQQVHNRLVTMLNANDITMDDLLSCYVKGMSKSDYLRGRVKYVCLEQGSQKFFDVLLQRQQTQTNGLQAINCKSDDIHIITELVHALARAISIDQFSMQEVFAYLAERCEQSKCGNNKIDGNRYTPSASISIEVVQA